MKGFFDPKLDEDPELNELKKFLQWFYPDKDPSEYNLEEVLAHLDLSQSRLLLWERNKTQALGNRYSVLFTKLVNYVKQRLSIPPLPSGECSLHKQLFEALNKTDSIITLNYDLVADQVLRRVDDPGGNQGPYALGTRVGKLHGLLRPQFTFGGFPPPPALRPEEKEVGFYLKLHGSLDWIYCPTQGCPNNWGVFPLVRYEEGQAEGELCRYCGSSLEVFLVPPVATKRFDDRGLLAFLWNLAFRELRSADRWAVIGLSLAPTDFELRWLLKQALESRGKPSSELHLVNPSEQDRCNIASAIAGHFKQVFHYDRIESYISNKPIDVDK